MPSKTGLRAVLLAGCLAALAGCADIGQQPSTFDPREVRYRSDDQPPTLAELQELAPTVTNPELEEVPSLVREAIRDTALALGAQAGLAYRSFQINEFLDDHERELSQVYAFNTLAIRAPSGSVVMPPVVVEATDNYAVAEDGQAATATDRVYRIVAPGVLVPIVPSWRDYLVREWTIPEPPVPQLLPQNDAERLIWRTSIEEGFEEGVQQADDIFDYDLSRLGRAVEGMARYRSLVAQGIVTEIFLSEADRGIVGGGQELRVGERVVRIAAPAALTSESRDWRPVLITVPR